MWLVISNFILYQCIQAYLGTEREHDSCVFGYLQKIRVPLHDVHCISTQYNGQTKHWLYREPFVFLFSTSSLELIRVLGLEMDLEVELDQGCCLVSSQHGSSLILISCGPIVMLYPITCITCMKSEFWNIHPCKLDGRNHYWWFEFLSPSLPAWKERNIYYLYSGGHQGAVQMPKLSNGISSCRACGYHVTTLTRKCF